MIARNEWINEPSSEATRFFTPHRKHGISRRAFLGGLAGMVGAVALGTGSYVIAKKRRDEEAIASAEIEAAQAILADKTLSKNGYSAIPDHIQLRHIKTEYGTPLPTAAVSWNKRLEPVSARIYVYPDRHQFYLSYQSGQSVDIDFLPDDRMKTIQYASEHRWNAFPIEFSRETGEPCYPPGVKDEAEFALRIAHRASETFFTNVGKPSDLAARIRTHLAR